MRIAHFSDIHYCPKYLEEVDRCFRHAIDDAVEQDCALAVLSGDITDHRLDLHSPAVNRMLSAVKHLADRIPALILQGTLSHDPAGTLDVFRTLDARNQIFVADSICRVGWAYESRLWFPVDEESVRQASVVFSCLPSVNKGYLAAQMGAEEAAKGAGEIVADLLRAWAPLNTQAGNYGIPTAIVSHGTVQGCKTEHNVPMAGLDHEFTTANLFAANADATLLGHIHKYQKWESGGQVIAYPGSVGRLHFGEVDDKGYLVWDLAAGKAATTFRTTPAKRLLEIEVDGLPDLDPADYDVSGAHVRIRYEIDEEQRHLVNKTAIERAFEDAGAKEVRVEGRIRPIQRARAERMESSTSVEQKLDTWCEYTQTSNDPLQALLELVRTKSPDEIVTKVMEGAA